MENGKCMDSHSRRAPRAYKIENACIAGIFIKTRDMCVGFYTSVEESFASRNFLKQ